VAQKQKFIEGDYVYIKQQNKEETWEVYAVHKRGRKTRYSIKKVHGAGITLWCHVQGNKLEKVKKK